MSGSTSSSKGKDLTPGEFGELRSGVRRTLQGSLKDRLGGGLQGFRPGQVNTGNFTTQLTGAQREGIDQVQALADPNNSRQQLQTLQGIAGGNQLDLQNDPVFNANLDVLGRRVLGAFDPQEEANKALFARAGQQLPSSSAFAQSQSRISESKQQALTDLAAQFGGQQLQSNRDRQLQAGQQLQALEQSRLERAQAALETQDLPRLIEDLGLERAREEFGRRQAAIREQISLAAAVSSPTIGTRSKSSSGGVL